jgi:hypothetical protein
MTGTRFLFPPLFLLLLLRTRRWKSASGTTYFCLILEFGMATDSLVRTMQIVLTGIVLFAWARLMWSSQQDIGREEYAVGGMVVATVSMLWLLWTIWD